MATTGCPPIRYNPSNAFLAGTGISREQLEALDARLSAVRRDWLDEESASGDRNGLIRPDASLDCGFFELPAMMLSAYKQSRHKSELGRILKVAHDLREHVDRVVVLGATAFITGARALMEACCDPYFNELSRGERGSRPRIYFQGDAFDNDASQGLLKLLGNGKLARSIDDRWALVVISRNGGPLETAVAFRHFLAALRSSRGRDESSLPELVVPIIGSPGCPAELTAAISGREPFTVPEGVADGFSVFSSAGIVPAAVLGINVIELLEGAVTMNEHFRQAPPQQNSVLQFAGVNHLLATQRHLTTRVLSAWANALQTFGTWYCQLLAEARDTQEVDLPPFTAVPKCDMLFRFAQAPAGRPDVSITNLIVDTWRCDPLAVGSRDGEQGRWNACAERTFPELMSAAIERTNQSYRSGGWPTADIHLPQLREATFGQLLQMLMIATAIEARLARSSP